MPDVSFVTAKFRLEYKPTDVANPYQLRLVRLQDAGNTSIATNTPNLDPIESRLVSALEQLRRASTPISIRYDTRPEIAPLVWPLNFSDGALELIAAGAGANDEDWVVNLDTDVVDLRIRSFTPEGESAGLATVKVSAVQWLKTSKGVSLNIGDAIPADRQFSAIFHSEDNWRSEIKSKLKFENVRASWGDIPDRLLALYRGSDALTVDTTDAPYIYIPSSTGWLQLSLPKPVCSRPLEKQNSLVSVIDGRITVFHSPGVNDGAAIRRSITLSGAGAVNLTVTWVRKAIAPPKKEQAELKSGPEAKIENETRSYEIEPGDITFAADKTQIRGQADGFLYVACLLYTSPSPRDGLLSRMPSSA